MNLQDLNLIPARLVDGQLETLTLSGEWIPDTDTNFIILCQGAEDSTGFLLVTPTTNYYVTNTQIDTVYLIAKLEELTNLVSQTANTNVSFYTEGVPLAPVNPQVVTDCQTLINELQQYKVT